MEWPPRSGQQDYPEIDRAEWFPIETARRKMLKGQIGFLDRLEGETGERAPALRRGDDHDRRRTNDDR